MTNRNFVRPADTNLLARPVIIRGKKISGSDRVDGLTLVELMVSITISLIILAALSALFITSRSSYKYEEGMARVQESGRFATEFIAQDVRMAGYSGCIRKSKPVNNWVKASTASQYGPGLHLNGHTYTGTGGSNLTDWTPVLPSIFNADEVLPYTDVITIRRGSDVTAPLAQKMTPDQTGPVVIAGNPLNLRQYDIVLISDCERGDVFQITSPVTFSNVSNNSLGHLQDEGTPGNSTNALSVMFDKNAAILKLTARVYYVGRRGGNVNNTSQPPALFRKELSGGSFVSQELVEGVESLKVAFGIDSDSDLGADGYYRANAVTAAGWASVVSARIGVLVQTTDNVDATPDTKAYDVAGFTVDPADDNRRRHVYNMTVQLRNPY